MHRYASDRRARGNGRRDGTNFPLATVILAIRANDRPLPLASHTSQYHCIYIVRQSFLLGRLREHAGQVERKCHNGQGIRAAHVGYTGAYHGGM